jgi:hypothetical protein
MRLASADLSCDLRDSTYFSGAATGARQPLPMSSSYTSTYANGASSCVVQGGSVELSAIDQWEVSASPTQRWSSECQATKRRLH